VINWNTQDSYKSFEIFSPKALGKDHHRRNLDSLGSFESIIFENRLLRKTAVFPLQMPLPDIIELSDRWQVGLIYLSIWIKISDF